MLTDCRSFLTRGGAQGSVPLSGLAGRDTGYCLRRVHGPNSPCFGQSLRQNAIIDIQIASGGGLHILRARQHQVQLRTKAQRLLQKHVALCHQQGRILPPALRDSPARIVHGQCAAGRYARHGAARALRHGQKHALALPIGQRNGAHVAQRAIRVAFHLHLRVPAPADQTHEGRVFLRLQAHVHQAYVGRAFPHRAQVRVLRDFHGAVGEYVDLHAGRLALHGRGQRQRPRQIRASVAGFQASNGMLSQGMIRAARYDR